MGKLRENFGAKIKNLRKASGLTQEKLAEKSGLDAAYLGDVERGRRNLTIDNIEKVAKGLKVEPFRLFLFHLDSRDASVENKAIIKEKILDYIETLPEKKRKALLRIVSDIARF
ncbi:MAG: helix-turn-helix transcriptional regulator [Nitrospinae bacterium]|nr:helix-turn-helix transcriptional regulator [Nitrospinota bacterium]